jgi:hypothetical protein
MLRAETNNAGTIEDDKAVSRPGAAFFVDMETGGGKICCIPAAADVYYW